MITNEIDKRVDCVDQIGSVTFGVSLVYILYHP